MIRCVSWYTVTVTAIFKHQTFEALLEIEAQGNGLFKSATSSQKVISEGDPNPVSWEFDELE